MFKPKQLAQNGITGRDLGLLATCFLAGAALDFILNGVFKVVWILIYGPAYLVAVKALENLLLKTPFEKHMRLASVSLLSGALVLHLAATGYSTKVTYSMRVVSLNPLTLSSSLWPQKLIVMSDRLLRELTGKSIDQNINVVVSRVIDYGCIRSFAVETVDGVDVLKDPDSHWSWKTDAKEKTDQPPEKVGPGYEDQALPWCWFQFYRK